MPAYALGPKKPRIHPFAVIAPSTTIIGDVVIGARTSIWPGAVIRGDYGYIRIGTDCSIQDNVVVHCSAENPTIIGNGVTVAHSAVIHACRVGDECLIGVGALIFDGARVGKHSILGVGSTVLGGATVPPRSVAVGAPAKVIRSATKADLKLIKDSYKAYVAMSRRYAESKAFE
ncbi:MAG TPA: gamma carbonic anhydrase family protein [Candidatus Dormibacteraeota bacterium]|jgi:carbonic anhydrase/acetyltransferase-like protein (isoleucine patch superfamily)|nr:gamma carbonic anhydrase family protein [Candidatus Dormibacteraeota bacterium]